MLLAWTCSDVGRADRLADKRADGNYVSARVSITAYVRLYARESRQKCVGNVSRLNHGDESKCRKYESRRIHFRTGSVNSDVIPFPPCLLYFFYAPVFVESVGFNARAIDVSFCLFVPFFQHGNVKFSIPRVQSRVKRHFSQHSLATTDNQ